MSGLRVAIVSHRHPELSKGGGEQAAYALFRHLQARDDIDPVFIAGCERVQLGHDGDFGAFRGRADEILWSPPPMDYFRLLSAAPDLLRRQVRELFATLRPDIVHVQHYLGFGTDLYRVLAEEVGVPIVATLHEYLAICNHHGQMIKTNLQLCYEASPSECSACFPDFSSGKFFARKHQVVENFKKVDRFIAPSAFLAQRYEAWGVPPERIVVKENPLASRTSATPARRDASISAGPLRLGFFGRIDPFKGVEVLLDAIEIVETAAPGTVKLTLFAANLEIQTSDFRDRVAAQLRRLDRVAKFSGPYPNDAVTALMRQVDWVVVPSIWWENSPVVIQEAKAAGVPVLCSDIGGMKEKVAAGIDGAHFMVRSAIDLADKIEAIVAGRLTVSAPAVVSTSPIADFIEIYQAVRRPTRFAIEA